MAQNLRNFALINPVFSLFYNFMTFKHIFIALAVVLFAGIQAVSAQGEAKPKPAAWPERDAFHKVMAGTFHPAEEGNFEPIKKRSQEMADAAAAWQKSTIPAELASQANLKPTLDKLAKDSQALNEQVKAGAADADILKSLSALHDTFHTIVGLCRPGEHGEHENHAGGNGKGKGKGQGKGKGKGGK